MTYADVIAYRLDELCKERGITLNKLAMLSGLTHSTVNNFRLGSVKNPSLQTIHRIAVGLDMTVSEFLDFPLMNETVFDDE